MNVEKFKEDLAAYKDNLSKKLPEDTVDLMLHAHCMGYLDCINHLNEEFDTMIMADVVLDEINKLNPKINKHF